MNNSREARVVHDSFFDVDWHALIRRLPEPVLLLGNPPWVTNSQLGAIQSQNLPVKANFQGHSGLDAITGKSNFDISEWMLIRLLDALAGRRGWMAMLCKTAVARKLLHHIWKNRISLDWAEMISIDANASFGAAVDACLFLCSLSPCGGSTVCGVFRDDEANKASSVIGYRDSLLVADITTYDSWKHLAGECQYQWRSGVKHDCSKVMELRNLDGVFHNGLDEVVDIEEEFLFPMLKSSELANGRIEESIRWMLVPQRCVGDDTSILRTAAPKTWRYLLKHGDALDRRGSSIYRKRSRFSVFGIGEYTFSPWKVAISGLYKRLKFAVVGPSSGKPTVLDDTGYFIACQSAEEAQYISTMLNSEIAREFYSAYIFWDAKRPITVEVLRKLDLHALEKELGREGMLARHARGPGKAQLKLFDS